MSQKVNVKSVHALLDMKSSLSRYRSDTDSTLTKIRQKLERKQETLREQTFSYSRRLEDLHSQLRKQEINSHSDSYDSYNNSAYNDNYYLESEIREATEKLKEIRHYSNILDDAIYEYQVEANKLKKMLSSDVPRAETFLERKTDELEKYIALTNASSNSSTNTQKTSPTIQSNLGKPEADKDRDQASSNNLEKDELRIFEPISNNEARIYGVGDEKDIMNFGYVKKESSTSYGFDLAEWKQSLKLRSGSVKTAVLSVKSKKNINDLIEIKNELDIASFQSEINVSLTDLTGEVEANLVKNETKIAVSTKILYGLTIKPTYENYVSPVLNEFLYSSGHFIEAMSNLDTSLVNIKGHMALGANAKLRAKEAKVTSNLLQGNPFHAGLKVNFFNFDHFSKKHTHSTNNDQEVK